MFPTYNKRAKVEVGGNNIPKSMVSFFIVMSSVSVKIWLSLYLETIPVITLLLPHAENSVFGIVVDSRSDNFLVDIKGPALPFLPVLAFEGGIRRNIPKFEAGTLLYVWVVKANPGMNPELSCTDGFSAHPHVQYMIH
ncbi:uncharacterized protein [Cicer arietinum]|uniref:uncharacterized protein n=1 Tax=Cicer arietinum TaxID=3827 RepID=UPI003CC6C4D0